jgi:hypothetical protein
MPSRDAYPNDKDKRKWATWRTPREVYRLVTKALYYAKIIGCVSSVECWEAILMPFIHECEEAFDRMVEDADTPERQFRFQVLERDQWECVDCGSSKNLQVHHVVTRNECRKSGRLDLLTDPDNAVGLCDSCHAEVTGKERVHQERFKAYIEGTRATRLFGGEAVA